MSSICQFVVTGFIIKIEHYKKDNEDYTKILFNNTPKILGKPVAQTLALHTPGSVRMSKHEPFTAIGTISSKHDKLYLIAEQFHATPQTLNTN